MAGELIPPRANPTVRPGDKTPNKGAKPKPENRSDDAPVQPRRQRRTAKQNLKTIKTAGQSIAFFEGSKNYATAVKLEFLAGLVLFLLAPLSQKEIKFDKNYARRLIAWCVLFMLLFPMAGSQNSGVSRSAAWLGGLTLLTLAVLGGNPAKSFGGFSVNVSKIIADLVAKLQPQK